MRKPHYLIAGLSLAAALLLSACTSGSGAPFIDNHKQGGKTAAASRSKAKSKAPVHKASIKQSQQSGRYVVQRGDTLYSIAFRFGWDWRALAQRNSINSPYTIKPGQVIHINKPASAPTQTAAKQPASKPAPVAAVPAKPAAKPATQQAPAARARTGNWQWPTEGTTVAKFSSNTSLNKGIDIAGNLGQPVRATAKGTVVYAGSGLRGYGELVIIKHDEVFISAYGHNRRLLVNEGQQVSAGQQIAEMGSTGTDRVKLHFEIRRQGKPVDPMQYLPAR